jgi:hypothetical protein
MNILHGLFQNSDPRGEAIFSKKVSVCPPPLYGSVARLRNDLLLFLL